jgi:hypothetical protein
MARIQISNDPSGRITVSFPYDPLLVEKVKSIDGRRWHPVEKHREILGHQHTKTTGIYTHLSTKNVGKIRSPLDNLNLEGSDSDKI